MCFGASVLLRKASALKRIDVRYGPQNANGQTAFQIFCFLAIVLCIRVCGCTVHDENDRWTVY